MFPGEACVQIHAAWCLYGPEQLPSTFRLYLPFLLIPSCLRRNDAPHPLRGSEKNSPGEFWKYT